MGEGTPQAPLSAGEDGAPTDLTLDQAMALGVDMHKKGFAKRAEEIYRRVLGVDPEHVDALNFLGIACSQLGRKDEALTHLQRALALAPGNVDARNNLGNLFLERGDLPEAEAAYRAVLRVLPRHVHARTNLGTVQRQRGDLTAAEAAFRGALEIDPDHGEAHHQLGRLLRDTDRVEEALSAFRRALTLRPYNGNSYRLVGYTLAALGRVDEATEIYQRWLKLEPENPVARHHLAGCTGRDVPARAADDYVRRTFDGFASSFDEVLDRLEYRAPRLTADAVAAVVTPASATLDVLDAGAGTGLCGPLLRPYARHLVAVDLSSRMLEKAAARGVYDALHTAELAGYMHDQPGAFDVIVSADTLVYFGDLDVVLAASAIALRPGGHLVFTVEHATDDPTDGYRLNAHGRYAHGETYVRRALAAAGFVPLSLPRAHLRRENKIPVDGLVVTARRE